LGFWPAAKGLTIMLQNFDTKNHFNTLEQERTNSSYLGSANLEKRGVNFAKEGRLKKKKSKWEGGVKEGLGPVR